MLVWLFVVRHGQSTWNAERRAQGHQDPPLSAEGRAQVAELAEELVPEVQAGGAWGAGRPLVFCSDLRRAVETAEPLVAGWGVKLRPTRALRERMLGEAEGRTWRELKASSPEAFAAYTSGADRDALAGIEPYEAFRGRVLEALGRIVGKAEEVERPVVLVTHGGVVKVLLEEALGRDKRFMVGNAAVFRLRWEGGRLERVQERP